ncbi:MAG: NAD(P)/FAD-dependent oxidoreductase [Burkholderiaceae bacterium]
MRESPAPDHEVVVIGAGVAGIYMIKRLTDLGVSAIVLEGEPDLGGTWYKNRYPGARFDSESYTYGYSFSKTLLDEWHWKERFSPQPENLRYLNFVADRLDLRRHMRFDCRIQSAHFDEAQGLWRLGSADGETITCRFVVMALGLLSTPTLPRIPGRETFAGQAFHTFHWPAEPVSLAGKRVAVIGTGATAIQLIPVVAEQAAELTVFQRRPNWAAPLGNSTISEAEMAGIRARYDEIFASCDRSPYGFVHTPDRRGFYEVSREERLALWDELYGSPGFAIWLANFLEIFSDEAANAELSEYIASRIRQRVKDPVTAEKLIPRDHGFGVQRVPMESGYFEAYNRDNVHLVDITETPIQCITPAGIRTLDDPSDPSRTRDRAFDIIVYATGFDAITGAFDSIDIRGRDGQALRAKWRDGPSTYLGAMVHGFPNMLMPNGPQSGSASTNYPRGIEVGVDWCVRLLEHMRDRGQRLAEPTAAAEEKWTAHVAEMYQMLLMRKAKSWFTGYNSNVDGHEEGRIRYFVYNGGMPKYRSVLRDVAEEGYAGIRFEDDGGHATIAAPEPDFNSRRRARMGAAPASAGVAHGPAGAGAGAG